MTSVLLKLVSNSIEKLININKSSINIRDIFSYLISNEMLFTEIEQITFINNGKNITKDVHVLLKGTKEDPVIIHMYTTNSKLKEEILKRVFLYNHSDNHSDKEEEDDDEKISPEEQNDNNLKTIKLLSDKDFVYLLNIIINKPELINIASSFIINGNIVKKFEIKEIKGEFKYNDELIQIVELLNKINKDYDESKLKAIINHFEGNLNLSIRYIITN
jgi:hypothetical protein